MKTISWAGYKWKTMKPDGGQYHEDTPHLWYDDSCVRTFPNGLLALDAIYNPHKFVKLNGEVVYPEVAVGCISTLNKFSFGKFQICANFPHGNWLWPAFWLTGTKSWPPEVDIFEAYSNGKGSYRKFKWRTPFAPYAVRTNAWKNIYPHQKQFGQRQHCSFKHVYSDHYFTLEWKEKKLEIFYDGNLVRTFKDKKLLNQMAESGMYVVINNGVRNDAKNLKPGYETTPFFVKTFSYIPY